MSPARLWTKRVKNDPVLAAFERTGFGIASACFCQPSIVLETKLILALAEKPVLIFAGLALPVLSMRYSR